jgi:hypothetical protein
METDALRTLVRERLQNGRLPFNRMPRFSGAPAHGEVCDACDKPITKQQLVMEGFASTLGDRPKDEKPIQLHVTCFQIWDVERCALKS